MYIYIWSQCVPLNLKCTSLAGYLYSFVHYVLYIYIYYIFLHSYIRTEVTVMRASLHCYSKYTFVPCVFILNIVPQGGGAPDVWGVQAEDRGALHSFCPQMDDLRPHQM